MTPGEEDALVMKIAQGLYRWFDDEDTDCVRSAIREAVAHERERAELDAQCFRFWVREAANSPCDMAKLIANCVTEDDYRQAICPIATSAESAIKTAAIRRGEE